MSEQPNVEQSDREKSAPDLERAALHHRQKSSMQKVAEQIAVRLGTNDAAAHAQIGQAVLDLGRTQAQMLAVEALQPRVNNEREAPVDRFLWLVATKGIKKERPASIQQELATQFSSKPLGERAIAKLIAELLGEREVTSWLTIRRCIQKLGIDVTLAFVRKTQEIEAAGGMFLPDQSRRKTPGGIFFWLLRHEVSPELRRQIFPPAAAKVEEVPQVSKQSKKSHPRSASARLLWEERVLVREEAEAERGEVRTVKITLVGRPGKVVEEGHCVVVSMQQAAKIPPLPAGLPLPSLEQVGATRYTVYIANKQWKKVAEAIKDEEDILIIEGLPVLDGQQITVLATNVTTRNLQKAAKAPKPQKPQKARDTNAAESEAGGQADRVQ